MNTTETRTPTDADIADAIERSKREIIADIRSGRVPATVADFSELHDYVDANEYGGLCDDGPIEWLSFDDDMRGDRGARVQNAVHEWLVGGRGALGNGVHGMREVISTPDDAITTTETDDGDDEIRVAGPYLVRVDVNDESWSVALELTREPTYDRGTVLGDEICPNIDPAFDEYLGVDVADEWVQVVWIGTAAYTVAHAENVYCLAQR